jgi:hypothetical protein
MLAGATCLAAGLCLLSHAAAAPAPDLPKDAYQKAAEADIAQLQKHIATCVDSEKEAKRYGPTAKSLAMVLAMYGEALGDAALKDQALAVAGDLAKKDFKAAAASAKKLAVKPGSAPLADSGLYKMHKYNLDETMSPFRVGTVGGLNIEKDIRGVRDGKGKLEPSQLEVLAARTAVLLDYATNFPNDKAKTNKANTDEWNKLSKDSVELCKKIADEAAKGKSANDKELVKLVKGLDAKCVLCHNKFRDD